MPFLSIDPTATTVAQRQLATKYIGRYLGLGRDATKTEIEALVVTLLKNIVEEEQVTEKRNAISAITPFNP